MDVNTLYKFCRDNRKELIEALENHVDEIQSLTEAADDIPYTIQNQKRNRLLKRFLKLIKSYKEK